MRYWWVNQNQTFHQEIAGGYVWSPKRNANGARNPFYESMREVSPGDVIFSFVDTRVAAIGVAKSYCWECPKPMEFGSADQNWENVGCAVSAHGSLGAVGHLDSHARPFPDLRDAHAPVWLPVHRHPVQPRSNIQA
jgi:hypothetical protein